MTFKMDPRRAKYLAVHTHHLRNVGPGFGIELGHSILANFDLDVRNPASRIDAAVVGAVRNRQAPL